jgi:alkylation response protein AidB-like acyl-CoA dehydrogenase
VEFEWSAEDLAFREELRAFIEQTLPENWEDISKAGPGSREQAEYSRAFCGKMAERGWLTQHWPREYGGRDASFWRHHIVSELMWEYAEPRGPRYMTVNWVGPAIMEYGSEQQKRDHLPRISAGNVVWCQGFSEPEAGSDLASLRTLALRDGDDYVINGSKIWTSYVDSAEFIFLLVRTDPDSRGHHGITALLCPKDLPGIELREIPGPLGKAYFHEVFFRDVRVPVSSRLGPEHRGWDVVKFVLDRERVGGAAHYARAAATLDRIAEEAGRRGLLSRPDVQQRLALARAACEAARLLTYRVVDLRQKGSPPTPDTAIARIAGTRAVHAVADLALEVFGMAGLEYGTLADSYYRLALWAGVGVGTTEVNLNLIARHQLDLPQK